MTTLLTLHHDTYTKAVSERLLDYTKTWCPLHKPHPPYRHGGASLNVPESARRGRHVISEARNQPGWVGEGVVADSELRPA
jgi:hypothetical protein